MTELSQQDKDLTLRWAVREHRPDEVARMIAAGARFECADDSGRSALYLAADMGLLKEARLMLEAGAKVDWSHPTLGRTPLFAAVAKGHEQMVQLLLRHGACPNAVGANPEPPLIAAVVNMNPVCVWLLIGSGADVNAQHYAQRRTALHCCAERAAAEIEEQSLTIAEMLLNAGADVSAEDESRMTPLATAVSFGHYKLFERLMKVEGLSQWALDGALLEAVRGGCELQLITQLIERGADCALRHGGRTLMQIAPRAREDIRRLLRSVRTEREVESAMPVNPKHSPSGRSGEPDFGVL